MTLAAVRIATQKHLHRAFRSALKGNDSHFPQARLYYLVYVCDHHFSIAYGRPPSTRNYEEIDRAKEILSLPQATEDDARLISQVELWSITTRVLETFGFDAELSPPSSLAARMRRFNIEYDIWRADWSDRFGHHVHVGNYPRKGVKLHVDFAKLYLCSHAFRGLAPSPTQQPGGVLSFRDAPASGGRSANSASQTSSSRHEEETVELEEEGGRLHPDLEEVAAAGVHAAERILDTMVSDTEIQAHLNGLPLYFNTMIAFAVVFLFKIATKYSHVIAIDVDKTLKLVSNVENTLKTVAAEMCPRHLLVSVAKAVKTLSSTQSRKQEYGSYPNQALGNDSGGVSTPFRLPASLDPRITTDGMGMTNSNWDLGADFDWMSYDFLASDGAFVYQEIQDIGENHGQFLG